MMKKLIERFSGDKKNQLLIIVLVGVLLIVIIWPTSDGSGETSQLTAVTENISSTDDTLEAYVKKQEERLEKLLGSIQGAGQVTVMITAKGSKTLVVEKDTSTSNSNVNESDSAGGSRTSADSTYDETTVLNNSSGNGQPYVIQELEPEIEGVVVACEGGEKPEIVDAITQAVSVLYNLPVHKIKVVSMK